MNDLSKPWPLGLGTPDWWKFTLASLVVLAAAVPFDHPLVVWAQTWPQPVRYVLAELTPYGETGWLLYPSAALFVIAMAAWLIVRNRLLRLAISEFAQIFGFIFLAIGMPNLVATIVKRLVGRGRPQHYDDAGLLSLHPNITDWTFQSFPSGHATTAFALAFTVGFLASRWLRPMLVIAALIALSRIALGVHYPSDVIAGAILGTLGAYGVRLWFASRGWLFRVGPTGSIVNRPMSALRRYLSLRRRGSAPARPTGRP